jgi:hypothetical protein
LKYGRIEMDMQVCSAWVRGAHQGLIKAGWSQLLTYLTRCTHGQQLEMLGLLRFVGVAWWTHELEKS